MKKSRRKFIKNSGIIAGSLAVASKSAYATASLQTSVQHPSEQNNDIIVCVFQRGAADGLHSVIPYAEPNYFNLRPQTAVQEWTDLDGFFGLNPDLSALMPVWESGDLAIVHAVGSSSDSRSHFDAQDAMEYGDLNKNAIRTGWLSKFLKLTEDGQESAFRSVSLNSSVPKSIKGDIESLPVSSLQGFDIMSTQELYQETTEQIAGLYQSSEYFSEKSDILFSAINQVKDIDPADYPPENGADYSATEFSEQLRTLGVAIKADLGVEVACIDIGGWDHHNNLPESFTNRAIEFAEGLNSFYQDMGDRMNHITILCMTEFGRRVAENASQGTDHGKAGVMYAIGKQVNGKKVFTDWPGLTAENLNDGDLKVTTDFREVFAELLIKRKGFTGDINEILPDYIYNGGIDIFKS